jgi:hypothetical protein
MKKGRNFIGKTALKTWVRKSEKNIRAGRGDRPCAGKYRRKPIQWGNLTG